MASGGSSHGLATVLATGLSRSAAAGASAVTSFSPLLRITEDGNRRILETGGDYRSVATPLTATGSSVAAAAGASAGTCTVLGTDSEVTAATGAVDGQAVAGAAGEAIAQAAGTSAGSSTATGAADTTTTTSAIGACDGTATVAAIGASNAAGPGSAAGAASVRGATIREIALSPISLGGGGAAAYARRRRLNFASKAGVALGEIFTITAEILPGEARGVINPKKISGEIAISGKASGAGVTKGQFVVYSICVIEPGSASGFDTVSYDNDFLLTAAE